MKEEIVDIFDKWVGSILDDVHTVIPAKIVQYYGHTERKAKIELMVKLRNVNNQIVQVPPIDDVPVVFPGTNQFSFLFPLNPGDGILVLFSEVSLGGFLSSNNIVIDADDLNRFNLTDAIAIPGLWSFNNAPQNTTHIIELNDAGQIEIKGTTLKLKAGTESFVLGDSHKTALLALCSAIAAITPSGSSAGNIASIQAAFSTFNATLATMLSTTIKGE